MDIADVLKIDKGKCWAYGSTICKACQWSAE